MSLADQQRLLARLYTDAETRRRFFGAPGETAAEFGVGEVEAAALASVARDELEFFARTLASKRRREVEKLLHNLVRVAGEDFAPLFGRYVAAAEFAPQTVNKHVEDAIGFCRWLGAAPREETGTVPVRAEVSDVAGCELARLLVAGRFSRFACCVSRFDPRRGEFGRPRLRFFRRTRTGVKVFSL